MNSRFPLLSLISLLMRAGGWLAFLVGLGVGCIAGFVDPTDRFQRAYDEMRFSGGAAEVFDAFEWTCRHRDADCETLIAKASQLESVPPRIRADLRRGVTPRAAVLDQLREEQPGTFAYAVPVDDKVVSVDKILAAFLLVLVGGMLAIGGEIIGVAFAIEKNTHAAVELLRSEKKKELEAVLGRLEDLERSRVNAAAGAAT